MPYDKWYVSSESALA